MKRDEILYVIKSLARSKGLYGRLLESLNGMDAKQYDEIMTELESQNFGGAVDLVMYIES